MDRGSRWQQLKARVSRMRPIQKTAAGIGLLASVLGIYAFVVDQNEADAPLKPGESGTVAGVTYKLRDVECGKGVKDLPERMQRAYRAYEETTGKSRIKGQLCFARSELRNDSKQALSANRTGILLRVGDLTFPEVDAIPPEAPVLFPRESAEITWVVDIPDGVTATGLRFQFFDLEQKLRGFEYVLP